MKLEMKQICQLVSSKGLEWLIRVIFGSGIKSHMEPVHPKSGCGDPKRLCIVAVTKVRQCRLANSSPESVVHLHRGKDVVWHVGCG